jgi:toxin ParE1/3/4
LIEIRWTDAATADLEKIADYLFEKAPEHAFRVVRAIYNEPAKLREFPRLGRPGRVSGTRELVLTALPYLLIYVQIGEVIHLTRILHGAQKWP